MKKGGRIDGSQAVAGGPAGGKQLAVVDTQLGIYKTLEGERRRLAPMARIGMLSASMLVCLFGFMGRQGYLAAAGYGVGFEAFSLRALVLYGVIPLLISTALLILYRPRLRLLMGGRPQGLALCPAPAAGFFAGWLVWCLIQLAHALFPWTATWVSIPQIWQTGAEYAGRAPLVATLTFLVSALLPATTHELLHRGLIQPVLDPSGARLIRSFLPACLAAALSLDLPGLGVLIVWSLLAGWARSRGGSLAVSSLVSAGFASAMLLARKLFGLISEAIHKMPLIDPYRIRIFLVTLIAVLLTLLLAPVGLISMAARQRRMRRPDSRKQGETPLILFDTLTAAFCLLAVLGCLYFLI